MLIRCTVSEANPGPLARCFSNLTGPLTSKITDSGFAVLDGELIERPGYRQAQNAGRSLTETSFGSLNSKARRLVRGVLERIV